MVEHVVLKRPCWVAGLWLNIPDYDAPTQMVKPHERNTNYVNAVLTIPKVISAPLGYTAQMRVHAASRRLGAEMEGEFGQYKRFTWIWCRGRCSPCAA